MSLKSLCKAVVLVLGCSFTIMGCNERVDISVTNYPDYWTDPNYASSIAIGPVYNDVPDDYAYTFFESYLVDEFKNSSLSIYDRTEEHLEYSLDAALRAERESAISADLYLTSTVTAFQLDTSVVIVEEEIEYYLEDEWGILVLDEYGDPIVIVETIEYEQYEHKGTAELTYQVYDVETETLVAHESVRRSWTDPELKDDPNHFDFNKILSHAADNVIVAVADMNLPYASSLTVYREDALKVASDSKISEDNGILCDRYETDTKIELSKEPYVYLITQLPKDAEHNPFLVDIIKKPKEDKDREDISAETLFSQSFLWKMNACETMSINIESQYLYSLVDSDNGKAEFTARLWAGTTLIHRVDFKIEDK